MNPLMPHQREVLRQALKATHNTVFVVELEGKRYQVTDVTDHHCTSEVVLHAAPIRRFDENQDVPAQQQG